MKIEDRFQEEFNALTYSKDGDTLIGSADVTMLVPSLDSDAADPITNHAGEFEEVGMVTRMPDDMSGLILIPDSNPLRTTILSADYFFAIDRILDGVDSTCKVTDEGSFPVLFEFDEGVIILTPRIIKEEVKERVKDRVTTLLDMGYMYKGEEQPIMFPELEGSKDLTELPGVGTKTAGNLRGEGFLTVNEVVEDAKTAGGEGIVQADGIGEVTVEKFAEVEL